jgi:hypothetical protein
MEFSFRISIGRAHYNVYICRGTASGLLHYCYIATLLKRAAALLLHCYITEAGCYITATLLNCWSGLLHYCYTATLLKRATTLLLHCYFATLLKRATTLLLHCYIAEAGYYITATLLHCWSGLLHYCYIATLLKRATTLLLHCYIATLLKRAMALRSHRSRTRVCEQYRLCFCRSGTVNWTAAPPLEHLRQCTCDEHAFYCVSQELLASSCLPLGSLTAQQNLLSLCVMKSASVGSYITVQLLRMLRSVSTAKQKGVSAFTWLRITSGKDFPVPNE